MTVKELIAKLQTFDETRLVVACTKDNPYLEITEADYDGFHEIVMLLAEDTLL